MRDKQRTISKVLYRTLICLGVGNLVWVIGEAFIAGVEQESFYQAILGGMALVSGLQSRNYARLQDAFWLLYDETLGRKENQVIDYGTGPDTRGRGSG